MILIYHRLFFNLRRLTEFYELNVGSVAIAIQDASKAFDEYSKLQHSIV